MKNFLINNIDFFNSDSKRNIDKNLSYYKKESEIYQLNTSHLQDLETSIHNTVDKNIKLTELGENLFQYFRDINKNPL